MSPQNKPLLDSGGDTETNRRRFLCGTGLTAVSLTTQGFKFQLNKKACVSRDRLPLPLRVKGPLPVVSWQHGALLWFDQVPSNLTRRSDPAYVMRYNAEALETLFNGHRLAGATNVLGWFNESRVKRCS